MIQDLDRTLERLLRDQVPLRDELVSFDVPTDAFEARLSRAGLTLNLYLYDLRENHELRQADWPRERQPNGRVLTRPPKVRMDLAYIVSAWSPADPPDVLAEHALLGRVLRTLLRFPVVPPEFLQGALVGEDPPLPTFVAQPDGMRNPEFWSALRQAPRPVIHLVVTLAVEPSALAEPALAVPPVVSRTLALSERGGPVHRLTGRPPLPRAYGPGTPVRRMAVTPSPAARLQAPVRAARDVVRVQQVRPLAANDWVLLDDPARPEFVRLGAVAGPGEQDVAVSPPLRFAHDPTAAPIAVRRATVPDPDSIVVCLTAPVAAEADTLLVSGRERLTADDTLLIGDGARTEVVRVVAVSAGSGAGAIQVRPTVRFAHAAGCNLYRRVLEVAPADPAIATRLAAPAAQEGGTLVLDSALGPAGAVLMVGSGTGVEFCRLAAAATAGVPVAVAPSLRGNHPAGAPLRQLTVGAEVGTVQALAPAGQGVLLLDGAPAAIAPARRQQQALVSAGEVLQLDDPTQPAWLQVTRVDVEPGALAGGPDALVAIGGWVTDDATPARPVVGALATLVEPGLTAATDAAGHFTFANLPPGAYTLRVAAAGYAAVERAVQVPARTADEYRVMLGT
ncbi:MAG TPA: Pvc16 family protein [Chloroflexota bacterium]|nr:Pvc16 family protein [Chloroflexota bacterium]